MSALRTHDSVAPPRVLAAANGPLGATLLDVLAEHAVELAAVLVGPARTGGPDPCPFVTEWARRSEVPAIHVRSWRSDSAADALAGVEFDFLLSLAYDLILPDWVLRRARRLAVNLHRGLAPDFRGCYSTAWALEHGAPAVGATLHVMTAEVDAGPILARAELPAAPDLTAAELTPRVEQLAIELFAGSIDRVLAVDLEPVEQRGGRSFPHRLPPHELDAADLPALARRVRALHFPPHPPVRIRLGERRFAVVEADPRPAIDELAAGAHALAFSTCAGAFRHAFATAGTALVLPSAAPAAVYRAAQTTGLVVRFYDLDERLAARPESLAAALATGACVAVLPAPFGHRCDARAVELAHAAGATVLEDRSAAALGAQPLAGELAVVGVHPWLAVPDGALLLSAAALAEPRWLPPDMTLVGRRLEAAARAAEADRAQPYADAGDAGAPRAMSRWSQTALADGAAIASARTAAADAARDLMAALAPACPFTHWPTGTHAHGFPLIVEDPAATLAALVEADVDVVRPWVAGASGGRDLAERLLLITDGRAAAAASALAAEPIAVTA